MLRGPKPTICGTACPSFASKMYSDYRDNRKLPDTALPLNGKFQLEAPDAFLAIGSILAAYHLQHWPPCLDLLNGPVAECCDLLYL